MVTDNESKCPKCGGTLKYYDSVKRIVRMKCGRSYWMTIDRVMCVECKKTHRVIPDILLPYKHYESYIIKGFISGELSSFDLDFEDYPCELTVKHWIASQNLQRVL